MFMRRFASAEELERQRNKARKRRKKQSAAPTVHYFHQVDDPYSHLAVQKLDQLRKRYSLRFQPHLTSNPSADFQGDAAHFATWALRDAISIAPDFAALLPASSTAPDAATVAWANSALATQLDSRDFATAAIEVGSAVWANTPSKSASRSQTTAAPHVKVMEGDALRTALGHYQGAMFYFEGEWFWGVDRIRSLEQRLAAEGFDTASGPICVPEPAPEPIVDGTAKNVVLEYFPSLRSPYTAIGHQRVLNLVNQSGVSLNVRPVMPMLMRGIPAPQAKQRYIITDAGREGRAHGSTLGKIVDPFGEPVKKAFELFAAADVLGRGMEFVGTYLRAAWFDGKDITNPGVLQQIVEDSGLSFQDTLDQADETDWQAVLQANLQALNGDNLWGVPSFRVSGGKLSTPYVCWGQDRIWRVASDIARRI